MTKNEDTFTKSEFKDFIEMKFNKVLKEKDLKEKNISISFLYKYIIEGKKESESIPAEYKRVSDFYKDHKDTENIKILIQKIKNQGNKKAEFKIDNKYNPVNFLRFYYFILKGIKREDKNTCCYCGVSEATCKNFCENRKSGYNKRHRGFVLEIEKKDPTQGYSVENCDLACYICNNAKSDLFNTEEFRKIIAPDKIKEFLEKNKK